MREIDINECHNILINIASTFDEICRRHQIPYYMLGGTMLGAIRHKGFIPWDDDMDFGVERKYFRKLIQVLSEELPPPLKVRTLENCDCVFSNFIKIDNTRTEIINNGHDVFSEIGIGIDIFPLDHGRKNRFTTTLFASYVFLQLTIINFLFYDPAYRRGYKKYIAQFLQRINKVSIKNRLKFLDKIIITHTHNESVFLVNYYGRWRKKEIILKCIMGKPQVYPFENMMLTGVENPHGYLSALYENYMQAPPEEKRERHTSFMRYK
jgi:lipopolysaccharide cholinephosphotransferase